MEQQLTNNNTNGGGSFIEAGLQQINVREVGLVKTVHDIDRTVIMTKNGTPLHIRDIATVMQGPKIRLGRIGKTIIAPMVSCWTMTTWSKASCCCARARNPTPHWMPSMPRSRN